MGDDAGMAPQIIGDHRRCWSAGTEGIAAQAAEQFGEHCTLGGLQEEAVVPLTPVNPQAFDVYEAHVQTCAKHALVRDDKIITEFRADHNQRIIAVTAIDVEGRIHGIPHRVCTGTASQIRPLALRLGRADQGKGAYFEKIIAAFAIKLQGGKVVIDNKGIVPDAAIHSHRETDPVRQPAARRLDRQEEIVSINARIDSAILGVHIACGAEQLANLELVSAGATIERHLRCGVIGRKNVISTVTVYDQTLKRGTIVDPLDVEFTIQTRDKRVRTGRIRAHKEAVGTVRAVDLKKVHITGIAGIYNGNPAVCSPTRKVHAIGIATLSAVQIIRAFGGCDQIVAATALDRVGTRAAIKDVIIFSTFKPVSLTAAPKIVHARTTAQMVAAAAAQNQIITGPCRHIIIAHTCDNNVFRAARSDHITRAVCPNGQTLQQNINIARVRQRREVCDKVIRRRNQQGRHNPPAVAEDQIVALTARNRIKAAAAKDHVFARITADHIVAIRGENHVVARAASDIVSGTTTVNICNAAIVQRIEVAQNFHTCAGKAQSPAITQKQIVAGPAVKCIAIARSDDNIVTFAARNSISPVRRCRFGRHHGL